MCVCVCVRVHVRLSLHRYLFYSSAPATLPDHPPTHTHTQEKRNQSCLETVAVKPVWEERQSFEKEKKGWSCYGYRGFVQRVCFYTSCEYCEDDLQCYIWQQITNVTNAELHDNSTQDPVSSTYRYEFSVA